MLMRVRFENPTDIVPTEVDHITGDIPDDWEILDSDEILSRTLSVEGQ
jgi:hypothetical protein